MRNVAIIGAAASAALLGYGYMRHIMGVDPFGGITSRDTSGMAFQLSNVDLKHYTGDKLVSQAHVATLKVHKNRQVFDLSGIVNGSYYSEEGKIEFSADAAKWDANNLSLMVTSGAQVKHEDFDLSVPNFSVDQKREVLRVPGEIRGRLLEGSVVARNFTYNLRDRSYRIGPTTWVGNAAVPTQESERPTRSKWTFSTQGGTSSRGEIEVWQKATATDGEVLVQGDTIERNKKTDVITASGSVLYFSQKANLACDKVVVYRKEKRAVLTGNVRMLIKPKDSMERELKVEQGEIPPFRPVVPESVAASRPGNGSGNQEMDEEIRSAKTTRKYPTVVLADQIEYWYGKGQRRAVITGTPQAKQVLTGDAWRHVWTFRALYDGEKETLRLISTEGKKDTRMKTSLGDDVRATWVEISTKEGDDEWNGMGVEGDVYADDSEVPREEKKEEQPPNPEPKPQPPNKPPANG